MSSRTRWGVVFLFAIAMAWFEASSVYYLRSVVGRIEPYQVDPLPMQGPLGPLGNIEMVREAATMIMLLAVGMLAASEWQKRLAYTLIAFGVWDIFYYVFLHVMTGWPRSALDWDILFMLPLPWWGPVLAPVCIAVLMIVWGTLVTERPEPPPAAGLTRAAWASCALGVTLALYVFMADALGALPQGLDAATTVLPVSFHWPAFCVALALMAAPVVRNCVR